MHTPEPASTSNPSRDTGPLPEQTLIGSEINGYHVTRLFDQGGMSWVFEASHPQIGRRAAVKVLKPAGANDAKSRDRFLLEAKAIASLSNKHVVEIWNYGILPDGRQYLMMPLLEGEALDRYLARMHQLSALQTLQIAEQTLNALSEAHKKGIVHRDVKPGNIFLVREHTGDLLVKVMDFGLAAAQPVPMPDGEGPMKASWVAGTPSYVAPEQARGLVVGPAADLYALGGTLFELLAGEPPFPELPNQTVTELLRRQLNDPPPRLSSKIANLPEGLEELINSLLEKEPEKRPNSADVVRQQVQRLLKRIHTDATAIRMMAPAGLLAPEEATVPVVLAGSSLKPTDSTPVGMVSPRATDVAANGAPSAPVVGHSRFVSTQQLGLPKSRAGLLVLLALLLLLIGAGWLAIRGSRGSTVEELPVPVSALPAPVEKPAEKPVDPPHALVGIPAEPAAAEPVKPEPVKTEPAKPAAKPSEPDELSRPAQKTPKKYSVTVVNPKFAISAENCVPDEAWRKSRLADLNEISNSKSQLSATEMEATERRIFEQIKVATDRNACVSVQQGLSDFASKMIRE